MPSQKQLKWSELKVGLTVLAACVTLGVLIFLMSGTGGSVHFQNSTEIIF